VKFLEQEGTFADLSTAEYSRLIHLEDMLAALTKQFDKVVGALLQVIAIDVRIATSSVANRSDERYDPSSGMERARASQSERVINALQLLVPTIDEIIKGPRKSWKQLAVKRGI